MSKHFQSVANVACEKGVVMDIEASYTRLFVIALFLMVALFARGAYANTYNVTTLNATGGSCTGSAPTFTCDSVSAAISAAADGDVVTLISGTYELATYLNVGKSLTFDGAGAGATIIDANSVNRAFYFSYFAGNKNYGLKNLSVIAGQSTSWGGCVYLGGSNSTLTVENVTFDSCVSTDTGYGGGAIVVYSSGGSLELNGTNTFSNNVSANYGGAIAVMNGAVNFNGNNTFTLNQSGAGGGGAVGITTLNPATSALNFNGTTVFNSNSAVGGHGGAVTTYSSSASITFAVGSNTSGSNNAAGSGKYGGAFYIPRTAVTVRNLNFSGDGSTTNAYFGGGLYIYSDATIINSSFTNLVSSNNGGGIYQSGIGTLNNVTATGNTAGSDGGGVYFSTTSGLSTISDSNISNNKVTATGGKGGGVFSGGNVTITNSTFSNNNSALVSPLTALGGGVYADYVTMTGVTVSGNKAVRGGGVYASDSVGTSTVTDSTISGNFAIDGSSGATLGSSGGGIFSYGPINLIRTSIYSNIAHSYGAGVVGYYGLTATNTTISGNSIESNGDYGSGIYVGVNGCTVNGSTIVNNSTVKTGSGGGIYCSPSANVTLSIFANNTYSGGIDNCDGTVSSSGGNVEDSTSCGFSDGPDKPSVDPLLGVLANNGGATLTHKPQSGSPAIDLGGTSCASVSPDQRGYARPMDGDSDGTAKCDAGSVEYDVYSVEVIVHGGGSVQGSNGSTMSCDSTSGKCLEGHELNATPTYTAIGDSGYILSSWGGTGAADCSVPGGACNPTMTGDKQFIAYFEPDTNPQQLSVTLSNSTYGRVTSNYGGIDCQNADPELNSCSVNYKLNESVTLTATPVSGYQFDGWSGVGCPTTPDPCVLTMDSAKNVQANFSAKKYTLTTAISPAGMGSVSSSGATTAINCPDVNCSVDTLLMDQQVTLTVTPYPDTTFLGWSGGGCYGSSTTCVITVKNDYLVKAVFTQPVGVLNVDVIGDVGGAVVSSDVPQTINCKDLCSETYVHNSNVTLTAVADTGYTFAGWSGSAGCTGTASCIVTLDTLNAQNVEATFTLDSYALTINRSGDYLGSFVTSHDGLINCGSDCSEIYDAGRVITLTATPPDGVTFEGWSGAGCSGDWICNVTMDQVQTVTANFSGAGSSEEPDPSYIKTYTVTRTDDPTPDGCSPTDCSLREAVDAANASAGRDLVLLDVGTYTLTLAGVEDSNAAGDLDIVHSEFIKGAGSDQTIITIDIASTGNDPILHFAENLGGSSYIKGVKLTNGRGSAGGCITASSGDLELRDVIVQGCQATGTWSSSYYGGYGGGLFKDKVGSDISGKLTIKDSQFIGNQPKYSTYRGGGVYSEAEEVYISNTQFINNTGGSGAGFTNGTNNSVVIEVVDSTFSGNLGGTGGGIYTYGSSNLLSISRSLFVNNQAGSNGAAVWSTGSLRVANSTFTQNILTNSSATQSEQYTFGSALYIDNNYGTAQRQECNVVNNTIVDNHAPNVVDSSDPAIQNVAAAVYKKSNTFSCTLTNNIIANNTHRAEQLGGNCFDPGSEILWGGHNLVDDSDPCTLTAGLNGDVVVTGPVALKPLGDYGGSTQSFEPLSIASVMVDAGDEVTCGISPVNSVDQRGYGRPIDANGVANAGMECDIGAVEINPYVLTVSFVGIGRVTSDLGGIDCTEANAGCSGQYPHNEVVTLTPHETLGSGYVFNGWSGACTNASGNCVVTMDSAKSVTANFVLDTTTFTLSVVTSGPGSVTSSPAGVNCTDTTCNVDFANNTEVTLTAASQVGFEFKGWGGECSGFGDCVVTMNAAHNVTAAFDVEVNTVTLTVKGYGSVDANINELDCTSRSICTAVLADNTSLSLTATSLAGFYFKEWGGACSGSAGCDLTITGDVDIIAYFPTYRETGVFMNSEHGGKETTYPDRGYYPAGDGVTGVSRAHINADFEKYPRGECYHCHDFENPNPNMDWPMTFDVYGTKEEKVDFCANCHTDADPDANGVDGDTPVDFSFQGPTAFKKSVHYTRNLSWPGTQYSVDTNYPPMPAEGAGTCINCHSPHAHKYSSSYASLPTGIDPGTIPFPKQLVELTDVNNQDVSMADFPVGWPNVDGRDPDDAEDICYTCHDGDPVSNYDLSTYNSYMKYGETPASSVTGIKQSFDEMYHHPVKDSRQLDILDTDLVSRGDGDDDSVGYSSYLGSTQMEQDGVFFNHNPLTDGIAKYAAAAFKAECTTCHNPHLVSGTWADIASDPENDATPIVLPGIPSNSDPVAKGGGDWPNPTVPGYVPGEAWGDDPEEKVNALLLRMAKENPSARGTGGWELNIARGYPLEVEQFPIFNVAGEWAAQGKPYYPVDTTVGFDQPAVYQPPYGGMGPDKAFQPDGDRLPDFITFCLDCHRHPLKHGPVYWGAGWPIDMSGGIGSIPKEPHGFDAANIPTSSDPNSLTNPYPELCDASCANLDSAICLDVRSTELAESDPWYNKPRGAGFNAMMEPPYMMKDRVAGINYVLVCTDCHEPHGSNNRGLLRDHINGNRIADNGFKQVCTSCHRPWFGGMVGNETCGNGAPNAESTCGGCHYDKDETGAYQSRPRSLHRMNINELESSPSDSYVILKDPDAAHFDLQPNVVSACLDIDGGSGTSSAPGLIGVWAAGNIMKKADGSASQYATNDIDFIDPQGMLDWSNNNARVNFAKGDISNRVINTRNGGYFRTERRDCHSLRKTDPAWNSGSVNDAKAFSYEGKIKFVPKSATENANDPEDSVEMSLIDYTLGGAGANWAVRLSNRCCVATDANGDGVSDGDPAGDMYLQVMINVWDQDQVNPWRIAYSKIPVPEGALDYNNLIPVAATFDATDLTAPLRVYINGEDVTDGIGGVWTHDPAVYNPSVTNLYDQPIGMHINTSRHEDDWVTGDAAAPDGNAVAIWDGTNLNPGVHFGVDATICAFCDAAQGNHNFWGYMGQQRLYNIALDPDTICSNVKATAAYNDRWGNSPTQFDDMYTGYTAADCSNP